MVKKFTSVLSTKGDVSIPVLPGYIPVSNPSLNDPFDFGDVVSQYIRPVIPNENASSMTSSCKDKDDDTMSYMDEEEDANKTYAPYGIVKKMVNRPLLMRDYDGVVSLTLNGVPEGLSTFESRLFDWLEEMNGVHECLLNAHTMGQLDTVIKEANKVRVTRRSVAKPPSSSLIDDDNKKKKNKGLSLSGYKLAIHNVRKELFERTYDKEAFRNDLLSPQLVSDLNQCLSNALKKAKEVVSEGCGDATNLFSTHDHVSSLIREYNRRLDSFVTFKNESSAKESFKGRDASSWTSYTSVFKTIDAETTTFSKRLSDLISHSKTMCLDNIVDQKKSLDKLANMYGVLFETLKRWMSLLYATYPEMWRIVSGVLIYHSSDIGAHERNDNPFGTVEDVLRYSKTISLLKETEYDILDYVERHTSAFSRYLSSFSSV